jgi:16S rRNA (guanine966-N2)-methyltransferase
MPKKSLGQIRIIGGLWRSRKITFPDLEEIRPTSDRVRETLFNWLSPVISGAYCLDLFAGSGALGFEALSRGAKHVVMVDKSPTVIEHLRATAAQLGTSQFTLYQTKAPHEVILASQPFDIVFLDPPFHHNLILPSLEWLKKETLIHKDTLIYIETENAKAHFTFPDNLKILKQGKTPQVIYYLTQLDNN